MNYTAIQEYKTIYILLFFRSVNIFIFLSSTSLSKNYLKRFIKKIYIIFIT